MFYVGNLFVVGNILVVLNRCFVKLLKTYTFIKSIFLKVVLQNCTRLIICARQREREKPGPAGDIMTAAPDTQF